MLAVKLSKKVMVEEEDVDDEVIGEVEEAEDVMEASTHKGKHISKDKTETRVILHASLVINSVTTPQSVLMRSLSCKKPLRRK